MPKSWRGLWSSAAFAAALLSVALGGVLWATSLNGCILGAKEECDTAGVPPVNVSATAGNGSATVTWEIPAYDTLELETIHTMVLYAELGGTGEQCASADINHTPEGCVRACQSTGSTQCLATGLTNGVPYAFTVITTAYPHNMYDCTGYAFVRTDPVTPGAE